MIVTYVSTTGQRIYDPSYGANGECQYYKSIADWTLHSAFVGCGVQYHVGNGPAQDAYYKRYDPDNNKLVPDVYILS